jgi:hypothetical protein
MFPRYLLFSEFICPRGDRVFDEADKLAVEKMYDLCNQAFIKNDYTALRECVQAPFVF